MRNARMHRSCLSWLILATIGSPPVALGEDLGNADSQAQAVPETSKPPIQVATDRFADSRNGRLIQITRLHAPGPNDAGRPAILIVAGIDPRHAHASDVATALIDRLVKVHASALSRGDMYILAQLNSDAFVTPQTSLRPDSPRNAAALNTIDADRDGRFNEDPPVDLDGDGRILQMRIKNPPPGIGLRAEYVLEDSDPRLLRRADAGKSERPTYALLTESRDADHDGLFGEDGFDGVELDRNFPYHWPEFRDEAGRMPLSEPETRALAEWLLAHDNIVAVLTYTPADNLVNIPPGGKMDETGGAPATNHILDEDRGQWERIGAKFKEITHHKEAPTRDNEGTLQGWAYAQLGLWSFSTPIWVRPDQCPGTIQNPGGNAGATASPDSKGASEPPKPTDEKPTAEKPNDEKSKDDKPKDDKPKEEKPKDAPAGPTKIETEDGKWLALSDSLIAAGKAGGFAPWKPFKHPQLGDVEIGGWLPGFRQSIPVDDIPRLADEQAAFIADLLSRLPRLTITGPRIERLGDTIWRISIEAVNEGELPTRTNMGTRIHRLPPTRWSIDIERPRLLSGDRTQKTDAIPGGGTLAASWTISAKPGDTIKLSLKSPECGDRDIDVKVDAPKEANP